MRGGDTFIGQLWAQEGQWTVFGRHRALTHFLGFTPQSAYPHRTLETRVERATPHSLP